MAGVASGLAAGGLAGSVAYCDTDVSKYFDPEALERGAKAVREINQSPYAKKVFRLGTGGGGRVPRRGMPGVAWLCAGGFMWTPRVADAVNGVAGRGRHGVYAMGCGTPGLLGGSCVVFGWSER